MLEESFRKENVILEESRPLHSLEGDEESGGGWSNNVSSPPDPSSFTGEGLQDDTKRHAVILEPADYPIYQKPVKNLRVGQSFWM